MLYCHCIVEAKGHCKSFYKDFFFGVKKLHLAFVPVPHLSSIRVTMYSVRRWRSDRLRQPALLSQNKGWGLYFTRPLFIFFQDTVISWLPHHGESLFLFPATKAIKPCSSRQNCLCTSTPIAADWHMLPKKITPPSTVLCRLRGGLHSIIKLKTREKDREGM